MVILPTPSRLPPVTPSPFFFFLFSLDQAWAAEATVALVLGTSMRVLPARLLPEDVYRRGGDLIICNLQRYGEVCMHPCCCLPCRPRHQTTPPPCLYADSCLPLRVCFLGRRTTTRPRCGSLPPPTLSWVPWQPSLELTCSSSVVCPNPPI